MPAIERIFKCRIEELPTLSGFLIDSITRDLVDFTAYSPDFNAGYVSTFQSKRNQVIALLNPVNITAAKKVITSRLRTNVRNMRPLLTKLEGYVKRAAKSPGPAGPLTVAVKDFGILPLREKIANYDVEGIDLAMTTLKTNITNNYTQITDKGYNNAQRNTLYDLHTSINNDNQAQNLKDDERDLLVENNISVFNQLWDIMTEVCDTGKRIYKDTTPAKADDYTMTSLINRIRNEDVTARNKNVIIPISGTIEMERVADGTTAKNTGLTDLTYTEINSGNPPIAWAKKTEIIITAPSGKISIHNLSNTTEGKAQVKTFPKQ